MPIITQTQQLWSPLRMIYPESMYPELYKSEGYPLSPIEEQEMLLGIYGKYNYPYKKATSNITSGIESNGRGYYADQSLLNPNIPTTSSTTQRFGLNFPDVSFKIDNPFQENRFSMLDSFPKLPKLTVPTIPQRIDWKNPIAAKMAIDNIGNSVSFKPEPLKGLGKFTTSSKKPGFNWKAAAPAIGSGVGMIGNHVISDGFNTETGTAIANAGNMIGQAVGMANPILGGIISAGSGLLGGFWNKGFGVKENKKNIAAVEANTAAAINTGNELAQATDNQAVINASSNMVGKKNYKPRNLYEDGLFTDSGTKKGKKLLDDQNRAFAYQVQGLAMGADNADSIQGNNAQRYNTIAFGGPLDSLMYNNDNMGAIDYDFMSRNLAIKEKQADMKNKMPGIVGMPNNMFVLGGDKKIVASPSSVRVQKYPTNKQIKRKFTQDDYIHAGVYPSKDGGYHILDSDYKEIPISNEEAYRRVAEHASIQDKAKARNAWQDMFGPWYTEYALGGDVQTHGADYSIGQVYDVTEEEANRLKAMGYEFKIVN